MPIDSLAETGSSSKLILIIATGRYDDKSTAQWIQLEPNVVEFFKKPIEPQTLAEALHRTLKTLR